MRLSSLVFWVRRLKDLQWRKTRTSGDYVETDQRCGGVFVEVVGWCCGRIITWRDGGFGLGSSSE